VTDQEQSPLRLREGSDDYRQAEFLADHFERGIRFDHSTKRWHIWNGVRWAPDQVADVENAVLEYAKKAILAKNMSKVEGAAYFKLLNMASVAKALEALATMDDYKTDGSDWDQDPNLLGCENGIVDLRVNALVDNPGPEMLVTKTTGHKFVPFDSERDTFESRAPKFWQFLMEVTSEDTELALFYLLWFGYSLFGHTQEQRFLVLIGAGRNVKGALVNTIRHTFGEYNAKADSGLYMRTRFGSARSDGARADLMALKGGRVAIMSEPDGGEFNEEMLKAHTGGDPITARALFSNNVVSWVPTHSITFLTNQPPSVRDVGPAMAARVMIADFRERYEGERENKRLYGQLEAEAEGILAILCWAAKVWYDSELGLPIPARIQKASEEYLNSNDPIGQSMNDIFVIEPGAKSPAKHLYEAFTDWYMRSGATDDPPSMNVFAQHLAKRGLRNQHTRTGRVWHGIRVKNAMEIAEGSDEE